MTTRYCEVCGKDLGYQPITNTVLLCGDKCFNKWWAEQNAKAKFPEAGRGSPKAKKVGPDGE